MSGHSQPYHLWQANESGKPAWFIVEPYGDGLPPRKVGEKIDIRDHARIILCGWGSKAPLLVLRRYRLN